MINILYFVWCSDVKASLATKVVIFKVLRKANLLKGSNIHVTEDMPRSKLWHGSGSGECVMCKTLKVRKCDGLERGM